MRSIRIVTSSGVLKPVGRVEGLAQEGVDLGGRPVHRVAGALEGRRHAARVGQVAQQALRRAQRGHLVAHRQIGDAARAVHLRAAEVVRRDVLAEDALDDAGTGEAEEGVRRLDHEAALARQVGAAAGVVPEHAHDARRDAADLAQRRERLGVAVEAADPGRHEGARAVVHADAGDAAVAGQVDEVGELAAVGGVHGAGADGEVVAVQRHVATADLDHRGDDGGAVEVRTPVLVEHRRLRVGILQDLDPLPHRHAILGVLADRLHGAGGDERLASQLLAGDESPIVGTLRGARRSRVVPLARERIVERRHHG